MADPDVSQLRSLRKKKAWRTIIERGEQLLAEKNDVAEVQVRAELGKAYLEVRQFESAREVLQSALRLQPRSPIVNRRMGELEIAAGNYTLALNYWNTLKKRRGPRVDSATFYNLAKVLRKLGRLDAAKRHATSGLSKFPRNPNLRDELERAQTMLDEGRTTEEADERKTDSARSHPYRHLNERNYWNRTVSPRNSLDIDNWYTKKFSISGLAISSAGSCFAQHIGRELRNNGFEYVDVEPPPDFLRADSHHDYGYGIYSARFGNVYTSRQLLQLVERSLHIFEPKDSIWESGGGYVDAFRPTIEPEPFERIEDIIESRQNHLEAVERMFKLSDVFIFTMGLTETWMSNDDGAVYPVAPGVSGGKYVETKYSFKNLTYDEILNDMEEFIMLVRRINERLKIILTVSPVPLMATASRHNVVVASSYSKSVLRAVAGYLSERHDLVDYFPSYEIVGSHIMRGQFFNPDGRTVSPYGVSHVMKQFFAEHVPPQVVRTERSGEISCDDVVCDEELINEFGPA